jgi:hypothetical protein
MPEWNQSPGGSPQSLDAVLEKIRLKLEGFKGVPVLILTTDSDFYQYIRQAIPGEAQSLSAPVSRGITP